MSGSFELAVCLYGVDRVVIQNASIRNIGMIVAIIPPARVYNRLAYPFV